MRLIDAEGIRIKPEFMHDVCGMAMIRVEDVVRILNEQPTIQPEQRTGKWIEHNGMFDTTCECSICHYKDYIPNAEQYICHDRYWFDRNFCPNCGAKMEEVTE